MRGPATRFRSHRPLPANYAVATSSACSGKIDSGNSATCTVTLSDEDITPPVITLNGSSTVSVVAGTTFTDPGAVVTDDVDASSTIFGTGTVDTNNVGTYTLHYNATDTSGNAALEVLRSVVVTPAPITVTADSQTKVYGASDPTLTYKITSGSLIATDTPASFTGSLLRDSGENVGTYSINQGSLALNSNYSLTFVTSTMSVTPAPVNVTASDDTMVYGGTVPTITATYDPVITPATPATCSTVADNTSSVGAYASNCTAAPDSNYSFTYTSGSVSVTPAPVNVTASDDTMVYGGTVPTITATYDPVITPATPATCSTVADNTSSVGAYASNCTAAPDSNYSFTYTSGSVSVTPAPVNVTASDDTMVYGGTVPTITATYDPVITPATPATCSTVADNTSSVGAYASNCTAAPDSNYSFTYTSGSVSVTPAPVNVTASDDTMVYGGTVPTITATTSSLFFVINRVSREEVNNMNTKNIIVSFVAFVAVALMTYSDQLKPAIITTMDVVFMEMVLVVDMGGGTAIATGIAIGRTKAGFDASNTHHNQTVRPVRLT